LKKDPADRYSDMEELRKDLTPILRRVEAH